MQLPKLIAGIADELNETARRANPHSVANVVDYCSWLKRFQRGWGGFVRQRERSKGSVHPFARGAAISL